MLEQYLNLLGKAYLVPIAFLAIGAWTVKFIVGLHESKRRDRKEFLELWQNHKEMSDLEIEVTVRHLFGVYLPADLIRRINSMPFPSDALVQMIDLWPFVRFDHASRQLEWKKEDYAVRVSRWKHITGWGLGYIALATPACYLYFFMVGNGPEKLETWLAALFGSVLVSLAIWCISQCIDLLTAGRFGNDLILRINAQAAALPRTLTALAPGIFHEAHQSSQIIGSQAHESGQIT